MSSIYKCVILDDEELAIKVIASHLEQIPDFELIGQFSNPVEAFQLLDRQCVDVLFLDIQMPEITGIAMLQMMKKPPLTVFTTAYREYALDGYELDVVDYLMKPIGFQRFLQTISRLRERLHMLNSIETKLPKHHPKVMDHLFIRTDRSYQKILFDNILHIEAVRNHVKVITQDASYISMIPISEVEGKLPGFFVRVHRSFIVNGLKLTRFNNHSVKHDKKEIPVGRSYKEDALKRISDFLLKSDD